MRKLKVSTRLALSFGLLIVLLALVDAIGLTRLRELQKVIELVVNNQVPKVVALDDIALKAMDNARLLRNVVLQTDEMALALNKKEFDANNEAIDQQVDYLRQNMGNPADQARLQELQVARKAYADYTQEVLRLGLANQQAEASKVVFGDKYTTQTLYFSAIQKLVDAQREQMTAAAQESGNAYTTAFGLMMGLGVVACLFGIGLAFVIARGLLKQLGGEPAYAAEIATQIAAGNLAVTVDAGERDGGSMVHAMKAMRDSLASLVSHVRQNCDTIATASGQIAAGNLDMSQRAEEQAGSLEETAASMEELTGTVKQNADNARQANELARAASEVAVQGGSVMGQVVDTMEAINASSKRVADIIGVIDGIAFQTNILALNAAVEAARAGEQGRGFAVVAQEVRNLAQRSAAAAKEIRALIDDSVDKVGAGSQLVGQAGATMQEIVGSIRRVTDIMAEIAAASAEQTRGIEQVNQAITQMDQVTQQNAALVEQASAAANALQEQAASLVEAVSMFKLAAEAEAEAKRLIAAQQRPAQALAARRAPGELPPPADLPAPSVPAPRVPADASQEWQEF